MIICECLYQMDLSKDDVHLLAKILSLGLVDADPNYLHHLKGYRDLQDRWAPVKYMEVIDTAFVWRLIRSMSRMVQNFLTGSFYFIVNSDWYIY